LQGNFGIFLKKMLLIYATLYGMKKEVRKNSHLSFTEQVYQQLLRVPKGKVTTYSALAKAVNSKAIRAVGSAMRKNPLPIIVPCHRVVKSTGEIGQYALGGSQVKAELLRQEGIDIENGNVQNLAQYLFDFSED
jgi:methylated-DNA-[protein]-cysteine S-methyltransferase